MNRLLACSSISLALIIALAIPATAQPGAPGQMVEISATIFEFRYDTETQFGIFYQFNENDSAGAVRNSDVFLPGTQNPQTDDPIPALDLTGSFAKIDYGDIDFNVKAALQEGWGTVISNQNLMTAEGQLAHIHLGEQVPYTTVRTSGNKTNLNLVFKNTGIRLEATPYILHEDKILLDLQISSNDIVRFEIFERGEGLRYELPVISTRSVRTVVILPAGERLYIGGLWSSSDGDTVRKVPIVGDLPGFGFFFRGFNKRAEKAETLFQIIPRIVQPGAGGLQTDLNNLSGVLEDPDGGMDLVQPESSVRSFRQGPSTPPAFVPEELNQRPRVIEVLPQEETESPAEPEATEQEETETEEEQTAKKSPVRKNSKGRIIGN